MIKKIIKLYNFQNYIIFKINMKSFRNPKYLERYEDVVFDLEQTVNITPENTNEQKREGKRIVADNSGEATPFDWYNSRLSVDFKVDKLADGAALTLTDHNGIVNGSRVEHVRNDADNAFEPTVTLYDVNENYNKGFAARKALLGTSVEVNCEIPLNRYSFFESLEDKLLPNTKIELNIEFDNDKNLIWRQGAADAAGTSYRLIVTRLQLFLPRLVFNSEGQKLYMENYLKPYKWTYLKETVFTSNLSTQSSGHFRITNGISKPRHVFVFFINNANINNQLQNSFLYNTFSVSTNPRTFNRCYLEVGNGNEYPDIHYKPTKDASRVFRDVMSYVYANNDYQGGTLLNISNFKTLYPFVYFDLTKQKMDIKDGVTKLSFHYELSGQTATDYIIFGIVLSEQEAEFEKEGGKLLLRA